MMLFLILCVVAFTLMSIVLIVQCDSCFEQEIERKNTEEIIAMLMKSKEKSKNQAPTAANAVDDDGDDNSPVVSHSNRASALAKQLKQKQSAKMKRKTKVSKKKIKSLGGAMSLKKKKLVKSALVTVSKKPLKRKPLSGISVKSKMASKLKTKRSKVSKLKLSQEQCSIRSNQSSPVLETKSTGSGYYYQLVKQIRVTSVSQYGVPPPKQFPHPSN